MAIASDTALGAKATANRRGGMFSASPPPMIADSAVNAQTNNMLAAGAGQKRAAQVGMDRAGVSRGKGQAHMAEMAAANADVEARVGAAGVEQQAANSNAAARLAYEGAMNAERMGQQGLLENLRSQRASERLANRGFQQDMYEATRRGQFGLDSQYLDFTPLLSGLFR